MTIYNNPCEVVFKDSMGSDKTVVNAARVSFDKEIDLITKSDERLISYLSKHNHFTPFTHCQIILRETVPLFVARQRFKHKVGFDYLLFSENEISRRYVSEDPDFYVPEKWRAKSDTLKQGSSEDKFVEKYKLFPFIKWFRKGGEDAIWKEPLKMYKHLLGVGVAPEQARMVLPQNMMTSYYVTGSLYAFSRAYMLRHPDDENVQWEIRELAKEWDRIISKKYPLSWKALTNK